MCWVWNIPCYFLSLNCSVQSQTSSSISRTPAQSCFIEHVVAYSPISFCNLYFLKAFEQNIMLNGQFMSIKVTRSVPGSTFLSSGRPKVGSNSPLQFRGRIYIEVYHSLKWMDFATGAIGLWNRDTWEEESRTGRIKRTGVLYRVSSLRFVFDWISSIYTYFHMIQVHIASAIH